MHETDIDALRDRAEQAENEGRGIRLGVGETRLVRYALRTLCGQFGDNWYPDWVKRNDIPACD